MAGSRVIRARYPIGSSGHRRRSIGFVAGAVIVRVSALLTACGDGEEKPSGSVEARRDITGASIGGTSKESILEGPEGSEEAPAATVVRTPSAGRAETVSIAQARAESFEFSGDAVDFGDVREKLSFETPRDGEEVTSPFKLQIGTEGLIVRRPNSTTGPQRRYGHHHIFVDDTVVPNPDSKIPVDDSHIHFHAIESEVVLDLEPGQHTLTLVFGDAYDYPYEFDGADVALLTETITVNVVGARKIFFIEPEDEAAIREFPFNVRVGSTDVDESTGHYVIVWGAVYPFPPEGERVPEDDNHIHMAPGQMEIEMDIKAGGHKFTLLFVDENNMLSDPPLTASIEVAVWKPTKLEGVTAGVDACWHSLPGKHHAHASALLGPP